MTNNRLSKPAASRSSSGTSDKLHVHLYTLHLWAIYCGHSPQGSHDVKRYSQGLLERQHALLKLHAQRPPAPLHPTMLYDKNPPYPHYEHLPYAQEPWKSLYVLQRLATTLAMVPWWATYYTVMPRSVRPRSSWNLRQIVYVNFTRRIFKVTEVAGVTWGTRDPTAEPSDAMLKETTFEWVEPLPEKYRLGIVKEGNVPFTRVGCFVWPRETRGKIGEMKDRLFRSSATRDLENLVDDANKTHVVGLFMHGGGYCHMSAHENSRTSRIPRGLIKVRTPFLKPHPILTSTRKESWTNATR